MQAHLDVISPKLQELRNGTWQNLSKHIFNRLHFISVDFEIVTADDAEVVATLVNSAYRGQGAKQGWTTETDYLDGQRIDATMLRELLSDDSIVLVFPNRINPEGCINIQRNGDLLYLGMLTVSPLKQSKGLGSIILETAQRFAQTKWANLKTAKMTVLNTRDELIAWYERKGFAMTGQAESFPYGDERYGLPKRPDLVLLVMEKSL
jgi:GNAT superfamily N-acetyltransferase